MLLNPAIGRPSNIAMRRLDGSNVAPGNDTGTNTAGLSPEVGKAIGETAAGIIKGIGDAIGGDKPAPAPPPPPPSLIPGVSNGALAIGAGVVVLAVLAWIVLK